VAATNHHTVIATDAALFTWDKIEVYGRCVLRNMILGAHVIPFTSLFHVLLMTYF
jgi:hypothetical protein